jgi:DNA (cytosine-5)-methyltransferase 1
VPALWKDLSKITDYPAYLEQCWQEHLAERAPDAPTVISTFAGCGGSSLGYSMAGFKELLAIEWDDNAVETFRLNFDVPVIKGDIAEVSVEQVLRMTGLQVGELDAFDGSPPCQGFSTAGKREMSDSRNQLFREYVRLLRGLQPKVFVMENVSGMVKGKMKLIFAEILRELKASGYRVSARLLNAMYFGVPQSRERMIFIGVREDLGIEPSHPGAETQLLTASFVLDGLTTNTDEAYQRTPKYIRGLLSLMKDGEVASRYSGGTNYFNHKRNWNDRPSRTILKTPDTYHHLEDRLLTKEELKRLAGYPDKFIFMGDLVNYYNRIGNSVPPLFMRSIARHIRTQILDPIHRVDTGNE